MINRNPLLQQQPQLNLEPIKELMNRFKSVSNPETELQNMVAADPRIQSVLNLAKGRGVSLEQIARIMAQQKGIDINTLIANLTH